MLFRIWAERSAEHLKSYYLALIEMLYVVLQYHNTKYRIYMYHRFILFYFIYFFIRFIFLLMLFMYFLFSFMYLFACFANLFAHLFISYVLITFWSRFDHISYLLIKWWSNLLITWWPNVNAASMPEKNRPNIYNK